jgi:nicotinate phosphoribosyltransferase
MSFLPPRHAGLQTDLYELTMAAAYWAAGRSEDVATFELSVRSLPPQRSYLLAAGLQQAVEFLQSLSFSSEEIEFLRQHPSFEHVPSEFFEYLRSLKFTGSLAAMPEGTVVFGEEPLLRIMAPVIQAQLAETYLLSTLTYQTIVAAKAARIVQAAAGRSVVEFGTRRAHGPHAGLWAARASYIAGFTGTSNTLAGFDWGIPTVGTTAHSWTMSFDDELESFQRFAELFGDKTVLLIDTYDSGEAVRKALKAHVPFRGVRIDSGNLLQQCHQVRGLLDAGGRTDAIILASGDMNEYVITDLIARGAPIDMFGVGTDLVVSRDAPALNGIYKMVEIVHRGEARFTSKFSDSKVTLPGKKQVFRFRNAAAKLAYDVLGLETETHVDAEMLIRPVMEGGRLLEPMPRLETVRAHARNSLASLPEPLRRLDERCTYEVRRSPQLSALLEGLRSKYVPEVLPAAPRR